MLLVPNPSLHQRIAATIAEEITAGRLRPADRLPSEADLGRQLGVSRATIRMALQTLAREGLVETQPGRGSFVTAAVSEEPDELMSFTEMGRQSGLTATAKVLVQDVVPATLEDADQFGIAPGSDLFVLERLRLLDGVAVSIDRSRIRFALAPKLMEVDFRTESLYSALDRSGAEPVRADYTVRAVAADKPQARLLGVAVGTPLLLTTTRSHTRAGEIVEIGQMAYRGDRYRFRATVRRRPSAQ
jgi:GntR family transcriptional regulator